VTQRGRNRRRQAALNRRERLSPPRRPERPECDNGGFLAARPRAMMGALFPAPGPPVEEAP